MQDIIQRATLKKSGLSHWYDNVLNWMHKIPYKQCSTKKPVNVDRTAFTGFSYAPKLSFGNVICIRLYDF